MSKILLLAGLLLCSAPVLAQSPLKTTPAPAPDGKVAVPVSPVLPGEENLTARERVERDMLMPPRRNRAAALQAAEEAEETSSTAPEVHGPAVPEAVPTAPEPEAKHAAPAHRTTYHRRTTSSAHRSTTARRKTTTRKPVAHHTTTRKRR